MRVFLASDLTILLSMLSARNQESRLSLPWVEKYRPTTLETISSHEHILSTLSRFIQSGNLPHLLFYGPPGTGKTTTILATARKLFNSVPQIISSNVLELNASDERGIDVVREQIKTFASTRNIFSSKSIDLKLVILDEADFMTNSAQDALRRVIEKYVKNVRFCLICNDISKIIPAIQSRCTLFRFSPLNSSQIISRLDHIVSCEKININEAAKNSIIKIACGDMRKVINLLQSLSASFSNIQDEDVYSCCSLATPEQIQEIVHSLFNIDFEPCYLKLKSLKTQYGFSLMDILLSVFEYLLSMELSSILKIYLFEKLSELETHVAGGGNESVYLGSFVGIFQVARGLVDTSS